MSGFWEKTKSRLGLLSIFFLAGVVSLSSIVTYALFEAKKSDDGAYPGTVGLRSYFQKGSGSETDPFVIARPAHFYNLTRLQNLGVFPSKVYFSLGYDPAYPNDPYGSNSATDLKFYPDNVSTATNEMISYLDLTAMSSSHPFLSIGSEGTPFYGVFNGNKKTVKGLHVTSGPDDVGVFGYTNSGSLVENVCFQDLVVTDDGYSTAVAGLSTLYGESQTDLITAGASCIYHATNDVTLSTTRQVLLTYQKEVQTSEPSFTFHVPSLSVSGISYQLRSSSEYLTTVDNGNGTYTVNINRGSEDTSSKISVENNTAFLSTNGALLSGRLSLVASVYQNGIFYSRVLLTVKLSFLSTLVSSSDHEITVRGALDYVNTADPTDTNYTEYAHGVNIGYLIGHCDGSAQYCFVYGGSLAMNTTTSGVSNLAQETETGLIGEVGVSLNNEFTPQREYATVGDTGVVNFSSMYSTIASSSTFSAHTNGSTTYYTYSPTGLSANLFAPYLRTDGSTANGGWGNAVTNAANSIDFAGRQLIEDETGYARNFGVFKLTSSNYDTTTSPANTYLLGLGEFNVQYSASTTFSDFYYTTAEWHDAATSNQPSDTWKYTPGAANRIQLGTHMPSYSDSSTWSESLERRSNYVVRCSLSSTATSNYFYNCGGFLQSYFSYKLIDKTGSKVTPGSKNFGVFVKNVDLTSQKTSNITVFDSSLKLSDAGSDTFPSFTLNSTLYPVKSVNFSVKSEGGANVTVMASSRDGSGGYVGVYNKATALGSGKAYAPSYAMYLPYSNSVDNFAYFNYDYATGAVDSKATRAACGERLFAHTFNLPKGDYFIGSPSGSVYLYYVCAQGQENSGNTGDEESVYSQINIIANVDFVSVVPTALNFADETGTWGRCFLAFSGNFSSTSGTLSVSSVYGTSSSTTTIQKPANLVKILIDSEKSYPIVFNGTTYQKRFIVYPNG